MHSLSSMHSNIIQPGRAKLTALLWMLVGFAMLIFMLSMINRAIEMNEHDKTQRSIQFEVKAATKKSKPVRKPKKHKSKAQKISPPSVSMDLLNMELSGIDLGLSSFAADDIGNVDQKLLGDIKNVVMSGDMVDQKAEAKYTVAVTYPARARAKELEGFVILSLLIAETGKVIKVKVIESDPADVFDSSAVNAVKKWLFTPARYKGEPVKAWANQTIRFSLD